MNNNILQVLLNTLLNKVRGIYNRVKMLLNPTYIKVRITAIAQKMVNGLTNFKPKTQADYYTIGKWQVAKKLAYTVVIVVGFLCLIYVANLYRVYKSTTRGDAIRTYHYNSIFLKFANEDCRITAKSKYVAYQGHVSNGACNGEGTLYRSDGTIVYIGNFEKSMYNGEGKSYYPNQNLNYDGQFVDNLYSGVGSLYRENATLEYVGDFLSGMKDGQGILYNGGGNQIYQGTFSCDNIVYSELVGKSNTDIAEKYTGQSEVYELTDMNKFVVTLDEINALYAGTTSEESALDETVRAGAVYVLSNTFIMGQKSYTTISDIKKDFGEPTYEGNAYINMAEAISVNKLLEKRDSVLNGAVTMDSETVFSDYTTINSYDDDYLIYIYGFEKEGIIYTFVTNTRADDFAFYYIQLSDDSGISTDSTKSSEE